ncbi:hypothetical protein [Streptomyces sp. NPDC001480]|uniref:hypothetical protein n=1 Tax=Streptomyces sp. NPDC001480 TaxID=3364577 RepID=UPI00367C44CE
MPDPDPSPHSRFAAAVQGLAGHVLGALATGAQDRSGLADHVDAGDDTKAALAAVRVLGPDVFAPAALTGAPFGHADGQCVVEAFRVFPPSAADAPEAQWRDYASMALLGAHAEEFPALRALPRTIDITGLAWQAVSAAMAPLYCLTLPGLPSPFSDPPGRHARAVSQGVTRALLRRDHTTAARLARWAAFATARGSRTHLDLPAALRHLELYGGNDAHTALDVAIARLLTARPTGTTT